METKMTRIIFIVTLINLIGFAAFAQMKETDRTELQRHDLSVPGREVIQVRVDFAPGYVAPRHTHFGEEVIYVLEGMLEYRIDRRPPAVVKPGDVLFIPAGTPHSVKNIAAGNAAELATYIVEKGKSLITPVSENDLKDARNKYKEEKEMVINSIQYKFAPENADRAESLFRQLRDASVKEPGVITFEVGRSADDPNVFALWEVYIDKNALDTHLESEHFKRLVINGIRPMAQQRNAATVIPIAKVND